jgi:hypothetical protein
MGKYCSNCGKVMKDPKYDKCYDCFSQTSEKRKLVKQLKPKEKRDHNNNSFELDTERKIAISYGTLLFVFIMGVILGALLW